MKHKLEIAVFVFTIFAICLIFFGAMVSSGKGIREREERWNSVAVSAGQNRQMLAKQQREIIGLRIKVFRLNGIMDCFLDHFEDCKRLQERGK